MAEPTAGDVALACMSAFVDELSRWDSPGQISTSPRYAVADTEIGGETIPEGAEVRLLLDDKPLPARIPSAPSQPETTQVIKPQPAQGGVPGRERPQPA